MAAVKEHKCFERECPYFQKLDHEYWLERDRRQLEKKAMRVLERKNPLSFKQDRYDYVKAMSLQELKIFLNIQQ